MSTTSPNFALVLATSADVVAVDSHIANNFSTLDSVLAVAHTGTGQFKSGLALTSPTITSPTFTGAISGNYSITASTGQFATVTATGGALTVNSFNIGTYSYPTTNSADSTLLTMSGGNAKWLPSAPNTGANQALSNLTTIAFNTSLNNCTAGIVTVNSLIATAGSLTGLTVFQAGTGTFAGNLTITGTMTANVVNCTGGTITAGGITIGTWALPSTLGTTGQILRAAFSTAGWATPSMTTSVAFSLQTAAGLVIGATTSGAVNFLTTVFDPAGNVTTGVFTAPVAGTYEFSFLVYAIASGLAQGTMGFMIATTKYPVITAITSDTVSTAISGVMINTVGSGATVKIYAENVAGANSFRVATGTSPITAYFCGKRLYEF